MTRDEEVACVTAFKETGDQKYAHRLVEAHLLPTLRFVWRYGYFGLPIADLIQEGNVGLVGAVQGYDVSRGFRFMTYAIWHIRAMIHRYMQKNQRIVTIKRSGPWRCLFNIVFSSKEMLRIKKESEDGNTTFFELIGKEIGVSAEEAEEMLFVLHCDEVRLDQPASVSGEVSDVSQLEKSLSLFGIAQEDDPAEAFLEVETALIEDELVDRALGQLKDRERIIIKRRFLSSRQYTLQEVGDEIHFTKERVRQLEVGALEKLRKYFINEPYKGGKKEENLSWYDKKLAGREIEGAYRFWGTTGLKARKTFFVGLLFVIEVRFFLNCKHGWSFW